MFAAWGVLIASGFALFVGIGYILKLLHGRDGPMHKVDREIVQDHLRSRWF